MKLILTKYEIFCVHTACNEIEVKVNLWNHYFLFVLVCVLSTVPTLTNLDLYQLINCFSVPFQLFFQGMRPSASLPLAQWQPDWEVTVALWVLSASSEGFIWSPPAVGLFSDHPGGSASPPDPSDNPPNLNTFLKKTQPLRCFTKQQDPLFIIMRHTHRTFSGNKTGSEHSRWWIYVFP